MYTYSDVKFVIAVQHIDLYISAHLQSSNLILYMITIRVHFSYAVWGILAGSMCSTRGLWVYFFYISWSFAPKEFHWNNFVDLWQIAWSEQVWKTSLGFGAWEQPNTIKIDASKCVALLWALPTLQIFVAGGSVPILLHLVSSANHTDCHFKF